MFFCWANYGCRRLCGINSWRTSSWSQWCSTSSRKGNSDFSFETAIGSLMHYITTAEEKFSTYEYKFRLLPPLERKIRDKREKSCYLPSKFRKIRKIYRGERSLLLDNNLDKVKDDFLNYLSAQRGYSEHTLRAYSNDLLQFLNIIHKKGDKI